MPAGGLTLLLLVLALAVDKPAGLPRARPEDDVNCLIFDCDTETTTTTPTTVAAAATEPNCEVFDTCGSSKPEEKKTQAKTTSKPKTTEAPSREDCTTISDNIVDLDNVGDLRTIQDCNRNTSCEDYRDLGFVCVPYYNCREGLVITDGSGLIDLRGVDEDPECCTSKAAILDLSDNKCKIEGGGSKNAGKNVCCKNPNFRVQSCSIKSNCATPKKSFEECGRIVKDTQVRLTGASNSKTEVRTADGVSSVRSVGGSVAQPGEFPHMCLVYRLVAGQRSFVAGASLIGPNKVLSVAHKFYVNNGNNKWDIRNDKQIYVRCGEHNVKLKAEFLEFQDSRVSEMYIAPEYDDKLVYHDLVILVTQENFVYQEHISPVCLPQPGENFDSYEDCWSTGWGTEVYPDPNQPQQNYYSDELRKVQLPMVNNKECFSRLKAHKKFQDKPGFRLHDSWVCAGGEKEVDTCKGDGGSPHICKRKNEEKWVQVGAVNWGIKCGEGVPSVYSSVAADMCWIDWVLSCVPKASRSLDFRVVDSVDLRNADGRVESFNKLTEAQCGQWSKSHPNLTKKCTVDYTSNDVRSVDRK